MTTEKTIEAIKDNIANNPKTFVRKLPRDDKLPKATSGSW